MEAKYCENCNGIGDVSGKPCDICHGAGKMKHCSDCKRLFPASTTWFFRNRSTADRLSAQCKKCLMATNHGTRYKAKLYEVQALVRAARGEAGK